MKLTELEPRLLKVVHQDGRVLMYPADTIEEADGVHFLCPKCFVMNHGPIGTHAVQCFKPGVVHPTGPGRWPMSGTGLHDLTLTPSVLLMSGCAWHGFVTNGEVTTC